MKAPVKRRGFPRLTFDDNLPRSADAAVRSEEAAFLQDWLYLIAGKHPGVSRTAHQHYALSVVGIAGTDRGMQMETYSESNGFLAFDRSGFRSGEPITTF